MNTTCIRIACFGVLLGIGAARAAEWPAYQGNMEHTGYVDVSLPPMGAHPQSLWRAQAQTTPPSGLAVSNGRVLTTPETYFGTSAPLVAQSVADGHIEWSHDFGSIFSVNQPAVDSGVVYLQTSNNGGATYLHAYAIDGTFLWRAPFGSQWERYLGPIIVDGQVYFDGGEYGGMYGMSAADGSETFYTNLPQYDSWSPTWDDGVLIAYTDELDVVAPETGLVLFTIFDPDYVWGGYSPDQAPVVVGDFAYVTNGGRLVAFDLATHDIAWTRDIAATGQVSTDGDELFVVAGGALSVRDPATGDLLWSWVPSASGSATTRIIVTKSHVILGDDTSTYLVNRQTHLTDSTLDSTGLLAYAEQTIFIADTTGYVTAYAAPSDAIFASGFD